MDVNPLEGTEHTKSRGMDDTKPKTQIIGIEGDFCFPMPPG